MVDESELLRHCHERQVSEHATPDAWAARRTAFGRAILARVLNEREKKNKCQFIASVFVGVFGRVRVRTCLRTYVCACGVVSGERYSRVFFQKNVSELGAYVFVSVHVCECMTRVCICADCVLESDCSERREKKRRNVSSLCACMFVGVHVCACVRVREHVSVRAVESTCECAYMRM